MLHAHSLLNVDAPKPAGLLVVDDHDLVRLGLQTLVQTFAADHHRAVKVFEARSLQEALALYGQEQSAIDLVMLDLHLPDAHGLSGLTTFIARFPAAPVVVLSGVNDPAMVREALARGARAYLTKSGDLQNVVDYIRSLGLWRTPGNPGSQVPGGPTGWMNPSDAHAESGRMVQPTGSNDAAPAVRLTARQAELLDWILIGKSNREIADLTHLSEGTVKNHVSTMLLLFGVRSRAQLISHLR
jgi:DNA-binding NarL/FixJ family response regulator